MLILGMAPIIPAGALLFYYQKQVKTQTLTYHQNLAIASATSIRQYLATLTGRLAFTQKLENLLSENAGDDKIGDYLETVLQTNPDFMLIGIVDSRGQGLLVKGIPQMLSVYGKLDVSRDTVFLNSRRSGELVISKFSQQYGQPIASLVLPLTGGKYMFMVAGFGDLWNSLQTLSFGETGHIYLTDENGFVFRFNNYLPVVSWETLENFYRQDDLGRIESIDSTEGPLVGAYAKVPDINLVVLILQSQQEAFMLVRLITSMIVFFGLFILTCAYFAALYIARRIDSQVQLLNAGAMEISAGNLDTQIMEENAWPEFLNLMQTFNGMTAELKRYSLMQVDKIIDEKKKTDLLMSLMRDGVILAGPDHTPLFMNNVARELIKHDFFYAVTAGAQGEEKEQNAVEYLRSIKDDGLTLEDVSGNSETAKYYKVITESFGGGHEDEATLIVIRDITSDKAVELMKNDFLNGVAHDLKAPLLGIQGYARLIASDKIEQAKKRQYIEAMQSVSKKILVMIEDLLDVARIEAGNREIHKSRFKMADVIDRSIEFFKPQTDEKNISVELDTDRNSYVEADARLIERVVANLLSNAVKFTPEGGRVAVRYKIKGGSHVVSVADNGIGILPAHTDEIFNKFSQFGSERQKHSYGLGLAVVKQIVELHKGAIKVRSRVNKGTTFVVTLPGGANNKEDTVNETA